MSLSTFMQGAPPTRGLASFALTETGHVMSGTTVDDLGGGGSIVSTPGGTIACRIDALAGGEGLVGERLSDRSSHLLTLTAGVEVSTDDDFVIDGRGTFTVTAVREHSSELTRAVEVVET